MLQNRIDVTLEVTSRAAARSVTSPLLVNHAVSQIERPVSAVTVGVTQKTGGSVSPQVLQGTGMAFTFNHNIPHTTETCNCYLSYDCELPVLPLVRCLWGLVWAGWVACSG